MSYTKEQRIVNQSKPKKVKVEATPMGSVGGSPLIIPNHSGDHDAGRILKTPTEETNIVNKKYVDDSFPVTHASTTGQTTDDHHAQSHSHVSHTGIGASDHHAKTTSGEIDHNATINTHNLTTDISHDSISDVSADDHHAETHTIVSHDTSATGAELDTLTDNSMADTLHRHSELVASDGSPDPALSVDATGNVGIGTTGPDSQLEIKGASNSKLKLNRDGWVGGEENNIMFEHNGNAVYMAKIGSWVEGAASSVALRFYTATGGVVSENMVIRGSGNVGIGTISPDYELDVAGNIGVDEFIYHNGDPNTYLQFGIDFTKIFSGGEQMFFSYGGMGQEYVKLGDGGDIDINLNDDMLVEGSSGNVGIGTTSPTQPLSVNEKVCMTALGGVAIKLTNNTRAATVQGQTVRANPAANDSVILTAADDDECMGVFLEGGIADRAEAWVVVSGIADVAMGVGEAATAGNWVETNSTEAGYADATAASPAAAPQHFNEIGHCIETVAGVPSGHILARCVLHFN